MFLKKSFEYEVIDRIDAELKIAYVSKKYITIIHKFKAKYSGRNMAKVLIQTKYRSITNPPYSEVIEEKFIDMNELEDRIKYDSERIDRYRKEGWTEK